MHLKTAILSFNHPDLTAKTVRSARTFFKDEGILLLHNGSEQKHIAKLKSVFPDIEHLELKSNKGFTGGINFLLTHAFKSSDWILFLTNDCVLMQLPSQVPAIPDLVAPLIWSRKIGKIDSIGGWLHLKTGKLRHQKEIEACTPPEMLRYVPGTAFMIHKKLFESVGTFDERLGTYWEDVDYSLRAKALGFSLNSEPDLQIIHGIGKTCHKHSHYTTYLFQRNRKIVCRRHISTRQKLTFEFNYHLNLSRLAFTKLRRQNFSDLKLLYRAYVD